MDRQVRFQLGTLLMLLALGGFAVLLGAQETGIARPPQVTDGDRLFHEKGCVHCHGANAEGTDKGPSLQRIGLQRKREEIMHQIREGGATMPAFGEALEPVEVEEVADYLVLKRGTAAKKGRGR